MFDFKMITGLAAGAFLASAITASAAVTVGYASGAGSTPSASQLAPDFVLPAGGDVGPYTGNVDGLRKSAFQGIIAPGAAFDAAEYFAIIPSGGDTNPSTEAGYIFGSDQTYFSLLWGSPDAENSITFFKGGSEVFAINGQTVINNLVPNGLSNEIGNIVSFVFSGLDAFDSVVLSARAPGDGSGTGYRNSFEWANAQVPLPAPFLLLLGGMAGLGFVSRKRKAA